MSYGGKFRRGDRIRFRHGSNEYEGVIVRILSVIDGLEVQADAIGGVRVAMRSVIQVVAPNLTDKERDALLELLPESHPVLVSQLNGVRTGRGDGQMISGTTLHGLAEFGLVVGTRETVVATTGPLMWRLTPEGRRVAKAL